MVTNRYHIRTDGKYKCSACGAASSGVDILSKTEVFEEERGYSNAAYFYVNCPNCTRRLPISAFSEIGTDADKPKFEGAGSW